MGVLASGSFFGIFSVATFLAGSVFLVVLIIISPVMTNVSKPRSFCLHCARLSGGSPLCVRAFFPLWAVVEAEEEEVVEGEWVIVEEGRLLEEVVVEESTPFSW